MDHSSGSRIHDIVECSRFAVQLPSTQLWKFAPQRLKQELTKKTGEQCPPVRTKMHVRVIG